MERLEAKQVNGHTYYIFPRKGRRKTERRHTMLTKTSEVQRQLLSALEMEGKATV